MIILGAHIEGNPLRPSLMLQYRLDKAIEYWQENPQIMIITTGGKTPRYPQSEAEVMQQYLIKKGIPKTQILLEEHSTRTAHQFINAQNVLKNAGEKVGNVIIITNNFHLPRSMKGKTPGDKGSQVTAHIREPLAYLNSWLFDHPKP